MAGLRANSYAANATNCFRRSSNFYHREIPLLNIRYEYGDTRDNILNTTLLVRNASNHMMVCMDALENFLVVAGNKGSRFITFTNWITSFFQNLLANIINLNNVYNIIKNDIEVSNNITDVYF